MKATELRIGNLVKYVGYPTPVKVERVGQYGIMPDRDINGMQEEEWQLEIFEPIPLTEEWLKKFGFEKAKDGCFYIRFDEEKYVSIRHSGNLFHSFLVDENEGGMLFGLPDNQYVHQLQNLYFALTGEELTTK